MAAVVAAPASDMLNETVPVPTTAAAAAAAAVVAAPALGYRDYVAAEGTLVERTYRAMYENQTPAHVAMMKAHYLYGEHRYGDLAVWDALELLSQVTDESDPDTDLPQIVHAMQTAESLATRMKADPEMAKCDWLPLVGLIHDLGKIMLMPEYGGLPQWSVVGDIFPLGIPLHPACVYSDRGYQSLNDGVNGQAIPPEQACGFEKLHFSWSHDEYLASVLERSNTNLPREAIYMVRHHSFYPWHTPAKWDVEAQGRPYSEFASEFDHKMLPYLQMLQKADLYSKTRNVPDRAMYEELVKKYIPYPLKF